MPDDSPASLKLPQFWTQQPEVWFLQAEAQFQLKEITADDTKYHHVVAALDQVTASRILELLQNPPAATKYQAIKDRLLRTFGLSELQRANRIIDMPDLGDEPPSVLMDKMLALMGDHEPCFLFRQLFLRRMPEEIQSTLVHSKILDPRELSEAADRLWQSQASLVRKSKQERTVSARPVANPDFCYYNRFGQKATKYQQPCKYTSEPLSGNGQASRQ